MKEQQTECTLRRRNGKRIQRGYEQAFFELKSSLPENGAILNGENKPPKDAKCQTNRVHCKSLMYESNHSLNVIVAPLQSISDLRALPLRHTLLRLLIISALSP